MQGALKISERRACRLVGVHRASQRYASSPRLDDGELKRRIRELAFERRRFGYRRIYRLLRREGFEVNHKRVYRLYREAGLMVRKRRRRKSLIIEREPLVLPACANQTWSMDFVMDALSSSSIL